MYVLACAITVTFSARQCNKSYYLQLECSFFLSSWMLNIIKHHFLIHYSTLSPLSYVYVPLMALVKCQSRMGTALFHPHLCQARLSVANYTPPCPPTFQTLIHRERGRMLSRLFKCKCHHTWKVARKCRHSNDGTWQRSARIFSQCESEPCECLGLLRRPTDEKICVNVSLSDFKSLNKHFKVHFSAFKLPHQLTHTRIKSWM